MDFFDSTAVLTRASETDPAFALFASHVLRDVDHVLRPSCFSRTLDSDLESGRDKAGRLTSRGGGGRLDEG